MMVMVTRSVEETVERVVRDYFTRESIDSVLVAHEVDIDDETILKVTIVISSHFGVADERRMLGLVRHIRSALAEQEQDDFPMVDFMSMADARKMGLATA